MKPPVVPAKAGIQSRAAFAGTSGYLNRTSRQLIAVFVCFIAVCAGATAHAHQVNLSTARVELRPDRSVAVQVALKGSDADRLAGTQIYDAQKDVADPAKVAAGAGRIAAHVNAHVERHREGWQRMSARHGRSGAGRRRRDRAQLVFLPRRGGRPGLSLDGADRDRQVRPSGSR